MRKTKYLKSNMNNSRLLGLKFVRALNNYSKWRRFWTSPVQVTKNLESSRLACTGIPSTTGSPKITKRSPNVERNNGCYGGSLISVDSWECVTKIVTAHLEISIDRYRSLFHCVTKIVTAHLEISIDWYRSLFHWNRILLWFWCLNEQRRRYL